MNSDGESSRTSPLTVLNLREFETRKVPTDLILNADGSLNLFQVVVDKALITIGITKGVFRIQAGQFVGVVPLNNRCVANVEPRVPLANLTTMVRLAGHDPLAIAALRSYGVSTNPLQWMQDMLADSLLTYVMSIRDAGVIRRYEMKTEESSFPRGRINLNRTVTALASRGVAHRAWSTWFERSVDTPENRCLKAALLKLSSVYTDAAQRGRSGNRERARRINTALHLFASVGEDLDQDYLRNDVVLGETRLPATREYYRPALNVALRILRGEGLLLEGSGEAVLETSLLINMGEIFEKYVRTRLQHHASEEGWSTDVLDGNVEPGKQLLYAETTAEQRVLAPQRLPPKGVLDPKIVVTPDLVFRSADGTFPLVADVKNKLTKGDMPSRADVEQVATYGLRYGCRRVLLVYPRMERGASGMQPVGNLGQITVFQYHYDLAAVDMTVEAMAFSEAVKTLLLP